MATGQTLKRLSPMDAFLLRLESRTTHAHTASLLLFEPPAGAPADFLDQLFTLLMSVPHGQTPPFGYRLYRGRRWYRPRWEVVSDLDLTQHMHRSRLPAPGGLAELTAHVQAIHSLPLDLSRPLWDFHLIEGLERERFALYLKMHHALADGGTVVRLLTAFLAETREPFSVEHAIAKRRRMSEAQSPPAATSHRPGKGQSLRLALRALAQQVARRRSAAPEEVVPYVGPPSPFRVATGPDRSYAVLSLSLSRLRALRDRSGATINDLVLEICAAALRQYLADRGALTSRPLVASVPVALERGEGHVDEGNEVGAISMALPTHLSDVAERLAFIQRSMRKGKQILFSMPKSAIDTYMNLVLMPFALSQILGIGERIPPFWNVVISNVPGPRETLYMHGARLERMYPASVIFHGHALNITARGCGDELNFGLVSCRDAVPDLQKLAGYIGDAFDRLEGVLLARRDTAPAGTTSAD